uniref:Uncharacterized protein n=1 Tax=Rhizophora mucronata TaxID=61149 RepID=A0A2P2P3Z6_RHIMU
MGQYPRLGQKCGLKTTSMQTSAILAFPNDWQMHKGH